MAFNLTLEDIIAAHGRIKSLIRHTPLLGSALLSKVLGREIYVKAECLQITGSFKMRGASHRISKLNNDEVKKGVVAYSSGNHAQAVAAAAYGRGCSADIVMPADSPQIKIQSTKAWGGKVHLYDRNTESREDIAAKIAGEKEGAVLIPPYDDPDIIAGQGTLGYEVATDCKAMGIVPASMIIPCGGGGLTAGSCVAMKALQPECEIFVAEPVGYDDTIKSLQAGERLTVSKEGTQLCDALLSPSPGELTFPITKKLVSGGFAVDDIAVANAMAQAFNYFKLIVEPGGIAAFAAFLQNHKSLPEGACVVVLSGGNVDMKLYHQLTQSV